MRTGLIAEKKGDYDLALIHWNNLLKRLPKNDSAIASVKKRISLIKRE